ncbi:MAG: hypothetical protein KDE27_10365 [Planctomycetes bacterium]|nr:hypothetical protein [Planctomycetota bacterium]
MRRTAVLVLIASLAVGSAAQSGPPPAQTSRPQVAAGGVHYTFDSNSGVARPSGDYNEHRAFGGFVFKVPELALEIRGLNALLLTDIDARALLEREGGQDLPRRGVEPPAPRRRLSPERIRERVEQTLRTFGHEGVVGDAESADGVLDTVRFLYFEGGVVALRGGVEVLRCDRLWIAPLEDRIVAEAVELRYAADAAGQPTTVIVRGPRLTKEGTRWTGRDLTVTTCTAGEPHVAFAIGEAEILERERELEIFGRGLALQFGGVDVLPLPDAHFFTGSQSQFPIKRASASYSQKLGIQTEIVFGLPWNTTGGYLHELITGRPASEFRGDWEFGVGWIEKRGMPLSPALTYEAPGLYRGRTWGFALEDNGRDLREIQANFDGSPITNDGRTVVRSENRVFLGENTHLDLQAFRASDPAVLAEFFNGEYRESELPETSGYLHHQTGNHLITFGARTNLDDFSYRDNRTLAPRFVEELPVLTWNWLAQPIGQTPWETPIVLDSALDLGQRRSSFDSHVAVQPDDETFRADELVEISTPFLLGPVSVRPYVSGRGTFYDETVGGGSDTRIAFEAGVQLGTRLSRTFDWIGDDGPQSIRHVIAPRVSIMNRFHVDDGPAEFWQFDTTDAITEQNLVRVEVRNLLQRNDEPGDFLLFDLAQDFWPDASRDNAGDELGLLYYDFLVRPTGGALSFRDFSFAIYGDHDWRNGLRTLDTELRFGPLAGVTWTLEYRTDRVVDGAVGISASTRAFDRWDLFASSLFDLQTDEWITYGFGIRRNDHDWSIAVSGGYDPFTDQTSIRLEFVPTLPGIAQRQDRFGHSFLHDANFATQY